MPEEPTPPEATAAPVMPPVAVTDPQSVIDLRAWVVAHCRDSAVSRDTATYNRVSGLVRQIEDVLLNIPKES